MRAKSSKQSCPALCINDTKVLEWLGKSPDWYCETRLLKMDCTTKTKLIEAIIAVWYRDQEVAQNCLNLVESMPKRVKKLIKNS